MDRQRSEYFQSIAGHFFRLRGAPFFLSSRELDLVAKWEKTGIPLPVVLEGIERAFAVHKMKPGRKQKIQTLAFCASRVLEAFAQYRERKVGARKKTAAGKATREEKKKRARSEVERFLCFLPPAAAHLREPFSRALKVLSRRPLDEEKLEGIEGDIEELIWESCREEEKNMLKTELLAEHRFGDEEELLRVLKVRLVKALRDRYRIPYLSLFYY